MKGKPDWEKLGEIAQRAESLKDAGQLDFPTFRVLVAEAEKATNGNTQFVGILSSCAKIEWLDQLYREEQAARKARRKKRPAA